MSTSSTASRHSVILDSLPANSSQYHSNQEDNAAEVVLRAKAERITNHHEAPLLASFPASSSSSSHYSKSVAVSSSGRFPFAATVGSASGSSSTSNTPIASHFPGNLSQQQHQRELSSFGSGKENANVYLHAQQPSSRREFSGGSLMLAMNQNLGLAIKGNDGGSGTPQPNFVLHSPTTCYMFPKTPDSPPTNSPTSSSKSQFHSTSTSDTVPYTTSTSLSSSFTSYATASSTSALLASSSASSALPSSSSSSMSKAAALFNNAFPSSRYERTRTESVPVYSPPVPRSPKKSQPSFAYPHAQPAQQLQHRARHSLGGGGSGIGSGGGSGSGRGSSSRRRQSNIPSSTSSSSLSSSTSYQSSALSMSTHKSSSLFYSHSNSTPSSSASDSGSSSTTGRRTPSPSDERGSRRGIGNKSAGDGDGENDERADLSLTTTPTPKGTSSVIEKDNLHPIDQRHEQQEQQQDSDIVAAETSSHFTATAAALSSSSSSSSSSPTNNRTSGGGSDGEGGAGGAHNGNANRNEHQGGPSVGGGSASSTPRGHHHGGGGAHLRGGSVGGRGGGGGVGGGNGGSNLGVGVDKNTGRGQDLVNQLEAKVVILGSQGVGKTSIVHRYTSGHFSYSLSSTIGASFLTKKLVVEEVKVRLQIWDTAGQERFRSMAPLYYRGALAAVLVYDITSMNSFLDVQVWLSELRRNMSSDLIIHVVGSKADLGVRERGLRQVKEGFAKRMIASWVLEGEMKEDHLPLDSTGSGTGSYRNHYGEDSNSLRGRSAGSSLRSGQVLSLGRGGGRNGETDDRERLRKLTLLRDNNLGGDDEEENEQHRLEDEELSKEEGDRLASSALLAGGNGSGGGGGGGAGGAVGGGEGSGNGGGPPPGEEGFFSRLGLLGRSATMMDLTRGGTEKDDAATASYRSSREPSPGLPYSSSSQSLAYQSRARSHSYSTAQPPFLGGIGAANTRDRRMSTKTLASGIASSAAPHRRGTTGGEGTAVKSNRSATNAMPTAPSALVTPPALPTITTTAYAATSPVTMCFATGSEGDERLEAGAGSTSTARASGSGPLNASMGPSPNALDSPATPSIARQLLASSGALSSTNSVLTSDPSTQLQLHYPNPHVYAESTKMSSSSSSATLASIAMGRSRSSQSSKLFPMSGANSAAGGSFYSIGALPSSNSIVNLNANSGYGVILSTNASGGPSREDEDSIKRRRKKANERAAKKMERSEIVQEVMEGAGVELSEVSAKDDYGIEDLFLLITRRLVERKAKIESDRILRSRDSIMLHEHMGSGDGRFGNGAGGSYGWCCT